VTRRSNVKKSAQQRLAGVSCPQRLIEPLSAEWGTVTSPADLP
jgi:hypothetical protein